MQNGEIWTWQGPVGLDGDKGNLRISLPGGRWELGVLGATGLAQALQLATGLTSLEIW